MKNLPRKLKKKLYGTRTMRKKGYRGITGILLENKKYIKAIAESVSGKRDLEFYKSFWEKFTPNPSNEDSIYKWNINVVQP